MFQQNDDQRSTTASDEDGSVTPRSVRFVERASESSEQEPEDKKDTQVSDSENNSQKDFNNSTHR